MTAVGEGVWVGSAAAPVGVGVDAAAAAAVAVATGVTSDATEDVGVTGSIVTSPESLVPRHAAPTSQSARRPANPPRAYRTAAGLVR